MKPVRLRTFLRATAGVLTGIGICVLLAGQMPLREAPVEARISFATEEELHAFIDAVSGGPVSVAQVRGAEATVYAPPADYVQLVAAGYTLTPVTKRVPKHFNGYHTVGSLQDDLEVYAAVFPEICRLESLGTSVNGEEIWVMRITDNPDLEEDEPEFKYVGTMHGDEHIATEMCTYFIDLLLNNYATDPRIRALVDETDISIVPLMNPDGLNLFQRQNANFVDLNRNFPIFEEHYTGTYYDGAPLNLEGRQPETIALMTWSAANSFVLSANYHTGALVVNYPYDYAPGVFSGQDAPSPDDLLFEEISLRYAELNAPMSASTAFPNGITNGSEWYSVADGMQDWVYRYLGCMEVTVELSVNKRPPPDDVPAFWEDNRESMLAYLESVHMGVRGIASDKRDGAPLWTRVTIAGNPQPVFSDPEVGDYYRLLLPGTYDLRFEAEGMIPYTARDVLVEDGVVTRLDVALSNGDVNGDGGVDAADVQAVVNAVLGISDPFGADVDGGGLSATDIQAVLLRAMLRAG